jgi:hypothetical protein
MRIGIDESWLKKSLRCFAWTQLDFLRHRTDMNIGLREGFINLVVELALHTQETHGAGDIAANCEVQGAGAELGEENFRSWCLHDFGVLIQGVL